MTRAFISDLHLDSERSAKYQAFQAVLSYTAERYDELYVLGDLVEVWVGDDDDSMFAHRLTNDLRHCAEHIPVFLMHGNRDFLYRETFAKRSGTQLLTDPFVLEASDLHERILLAHGDAYCTTDAEYMKLRTLFRSLSWQDHILASSLEERRVFARSLREQSKKANQLKPANITDVEEIAIENDLHEHKCTKMIHGHTHRAGVHTLHHGMTRVVLGDWDDCGWLLSQCGEEFTLERFAI